MVAAKAIKSRQKIDAVGVSPCFHPDQPQFSVQLVVHGRRVPPEVVVEVVGLKECLFHSFFFKEMDESSSDYLSQNAII